MAKAKTTPKAEPTRITPPNMRTVTIPIIGSAPLVINRFSKKVQDQILAAQLEPNKAKTKKRTAKDIKADFEGAQYVSDEGWRGMNAAAFRNAAISACRVAGFQMTKAKLSIFVEADGLDATDGTPLVRIEGKPEVYIAHCRNATGVVDIRIRPMWKQWKATLRIRYDGDQFTREDVANLINRVGCQVGIGEGRPDSKSSAGMGFGMFDIELAKEQAA